MSKLHPLLEKLENKRAELNLSMERFANEVLGVRYQTYWRWINERFNPSLDMVEKIHKVLEESNSRAVHRVRS